MRTTLVLSDTVLKQAKIEAEERGSTLRQLVIDAPQRELAAKEAPRKRLSRHPPSWRPMPVAPAEPGSGQAS